MEAAQLVTTTTLPEVHLLINMVDRAYWDDTNDAKNNDETYGHGCTKY